MFRDHASRHSVPGAAVGVLRDGAESTAYVGVADVATGEPVTAETRFAVGSLAKSMVATALARLAAAGRLAFDDPVSEHVPEVRNTGWGDEATLRDLLANRSGLPLRDALEFRGLPDERDDVLSRFAMLVAKAEPTAAIWSYTNSGWSLVGRAIETISGLTWEAAMRVHVLEPLGMEQTTFTTLAPAEPRASGHTTTADGAKPAAPWAPRSLGPAGSTLLSTLPDVLRFARAHLEDESLAVLRKVHADIRINAWLDAWCLGFARFDWIGGPVWGWDGVISGQRAILRLIPGRGAAVLLTNAENGRALYRSLFAELMEKWFGIGVPALELEPPREPAVDSSRFAGVYAWPDRRLEVRATEDGVTIEGDGEIVHGVPLDDRTVLVDPGDPDNPTVTFAALDESGRPGALYSMLWGLPRV